MFSRLIWENLPELFFISSFKVEAQLEDSRTDLLKERKVKERIESYNRKLESELNVLKQRERPGSGLQHEVSFEFLLSSGGRSAGQTSIRFITHVMFS